MRGPVLIVEDNEDTLEVLKLVLAMRGYAVATAVDGLDALAYLQAGGMPVAIILDIAMPVMDGIAFSERLRAEPRWAHIPVIVYTAMRAGLPAGAAAVFRKGTDDPDRLLALLGALCAKQ